MDSKVHVACMLSDQTIKKLSELSKAIDLIRRSDKNALCQRKEYENIVSVISVYF